MADNNQSSVASDIKELNARMLILERTSSKTEFQYTEIMKSLDKLNNITIPDLLKQVEELRNKPAKRYDQIVSALLGALVGAVVSFIAGKFLI